MGPPGHRVARPDAGDRDQPGQHLAHGHRHAGERRGCADQWRDRRLHRERCEPDDRHGHDQRVGRRDVLLHGTNAGTDQIVACYNADSTGPCEAQASATKTWTGVRP